MALHTYHNSDILWIKSDGTAILIRPKHSYCRWYQFRPCALRKRPFSSRSLGGLRDTPTWHYTHIRIAIYTTLKVVVLQYWAALSIHIEGDISWGFGLSEKEHHPFSSRSLRGLRDTPTRHYTRIRIAIRTTIKMVWCTPPLSSSKQSYWRWYKLSPWALRKQPFSHSSLGGLRDTPTWHYTCIRIAIYTTLFI